MMIRRNSQKGATLVEAILAVGLAVAVATGIVAAVTTSLSGATHNQNSNFTLNISQQGIDMIRDQAASDFTQFSATYAVPLSDGYYCLSDQDTALSDTNFDPNNTICNSSHPNVQTNSNTYVRKIYLNKSGNDARTSTVRKVCTVANTVFMASVVSYTDSECRGGLYCHKVEIDTCFTDINSLPEP